MEETGWYKKIKEQEDALQKVLEAVLFWMYIKFKCSHLAGCDLWFAIDFFRYSSNGWKFDKHLIYFEYKEKSCALWSHLAGWDLGFAIIFLDIHQI